MTTSPQPPSDSRRSDVAGMLRRVVASSSLEELLRESPGLSWDDLRACCAHAAEVLSKSAPPPAKIETVEWTAENAVELATVPPPAAEAVTMPPDVGATPLLPGKRISLPGYEILGKIGEGGMGVVYKARHLRLNRLVAIKMILAGEHASDAMIARFALEAEAVAQLQHPGIVQIHEIGEYDGHSFLALEYVAGGSLAARLDDKPWTADRAAELVETLARAMQAAHNRGIIHRDLKPENILVAEAAAVEDGQLAPKITDFGLAKRLQETAGRTRTGEIMGTPSYMAPEQAAGKKTIGPAADVYALGAVLYRLLTGRPPHQADTSLDTMMLVLEQEPAPPRSLNKKLPRDLETIALKCLAKEPAKRYASAAGLADDLRRYLDGEPIKARRFSVRQRLYRWCRKRPGAALARGMLFMVLLGLPAFASSVDKTMGLVMLGWVIGAVSFFVAITRTRLRPLLTGLSLTLIMTIISLICFALPIAGLVNGILNGDNWYTLKTLLPGFTVENLAILACSLPLLIGLLGGLFLSLRWRILSYCLLPVFLIASLRWPEGSIVLISIVIPPLCLGLLCRLVLWRCDSNIMDTVVGAFWGLVGGAFAGSFLSLAGCVHFRRHLRRSGPFTDVIVVLIRNRGDHRWSNPGCVPWSNQWESSHTARTRLRWVCGIDCLSPQRCPGYNALGGLAMPLRDHFRPPLDNKTSWEGFHGQWPAMLVMALVRNLPRRYVAEPRVHLGAFFEIDVASFEEEESGGFASVAGGDDGGVATAVWAPPQPTFEVSTDLPDQDEYEVRVYDTKRHRRLVAAVEVVSPANKDRPEHRRALAVKCAALLQQRVSVALVDLVTTRQFNLYADLLELIGQTDPSLVPEPPPLYVAACRWAREADTWRFRAWAHPLALGQPLPTLPLWLADNLAVPLELEASYEETCRILRIP